jgi:hypothetical protein
VCSERVPKKYGKGQKKGFGMRVRAGFRGTFGGGELKKNEKKLLWNASSRVGVVKGPKHTIEKNACEKNEKKILWNASSCWVS